MRSIVTTNTGIDDIDRHGWKEVRHHVIEILFIGVAFVVDGFDSIIFFFVNLKAALGNAVTEEGDGYAFLMEVILCFLSHFFKNLHNLCLTFRNNKFVFAGL